MKMNILKDIRNKNMTIVHNYNEKWALPEYHFKQIPIFDLPNGFCLGRITNLLKGYKLNPSWNGFIFMNRDNDTIVVTSQGYVFNMSELALETRYFYTSPTTAERPEIYGIGDQLYKAVGYYTGLSSFVGSDVYERDTITKEKNPSRLLNKTIERCLNHPSVIDEKKEKLRNLLAM